MSFEDASAFLSHARLIAQLAAGESMSAAQIAKYFRRVTAALSSAGRLFKTSSRDFASAAHLTRPMFARSSHATASSKSACSPTLTSPTLRHSLDVSAQSSGFLAILSLYYCDSSLLPAHGPRHGPYLQILHYQCVIAEFFDHALTVLYEFAPRGAVAEWVFSDTRRLSGPEIPSSTTRSPLTNWTRHGRARKRGRAY